MEAQAAKKHPIGYRISVKDNDPESTCFGDGFVAYVQVLLQA